MSKICYREINFRSESLRLIEQVNAIIHEYQDMGYSLTLRQVYYQLVSRDVIPNNERSYKNLGNLISDGRMSGLIDWNAIENRTRNLRKNSHWTSPGSIIHSAAYSFAYDKWEDQDSYVEVWVEKDALVGIVGQVCEELDIPYFSCRGYVSQSEMWAAAQRLEQFSAQKSIHIIHLGDHDPSGKDMSRDIVDRLELFGVSVEFQRIALNYDQIEEYGPPPNPTKLTDSRASGYISEFGHECWELDALRPDVIDGLIRDAVTDLCDLELLQEARDREETAKDTLKAVARDWPTIERNYSN
ncbi:hypothetical protein R70723_06570 [Paenibacillus sp. FSL R7-0273]|uniref:hypothetical protein n=1 Tax=Paenibacillus sp. FSL R7-0273 TaxID=1536772 RepID=UPI0004F8BE04|nr:hypothetical protein [Paenibacillus sp. FSL R7-0273]AIQ45598.1 hypothetical protein R70723_06570 [Paenibacillus sp. FSL R7-0273]OMF95114.1 hypothetical protein BK144_06150 [Paenibacillus sp. FSL R7-0273]